MKKIGNFFSRIWQWLKDTAWIQVILIVGGLITIILCIPPVVSAISNAIENSKQTNFYTKHRITYTEYLDLQKDQEPGDENQYIVLFYDETCSHCSAIEKYVEAFYKTYKDEVIYTIDVSDDDYITEANKDTLIDVYAPVYDNMASTDKNPNYETFPTEGISTPTFVLIRNNSPLKISLGLGETRADVFSDLQEFLDIN